jgi:hypothetical protein
MQVRVWQDHEEARESQVQRKPTRALTTPSKHILLKAARIPQKQHPAPILIAQAVQSHARTTGNQGVKSLALAKLAQSTLFPPMKPHYQILQTALQTRSFLSWPF